MPADIILVGNGPSVLRCQCGSMIDAFANIVRFNGHQLLGYAQHIGTRTTIWSRWYALPTMQPMEPLSRIWINMPVHERSEEKLEKAMKLLGLYQHKAEVIPSIKVATELQNALFGGPHPSKWPSSGLLAIAHSIDQGYKVALIGFDSWSSEPFHYYETHDRSNSHHVADLERTYIAELVRKGTIRHLMA